jgi:hypothetical protein
MRLALQMIKMKHRVIESNGIKMHLANKAPGGW